MDIASRRRSEIIQAAYKVFSEKGYHSTRIEDIASELNVAHGLFYHYFQNKLDIFSQIIDEVIIRITNGVITDAPDASDTLEEYGEQIQRLGERLLELFRDDPHISKILFYEALGIDDRINQKIQDAFDLFGQYTGMYVKNGVEKGFLRPDIPVKETALAINAMTFEAARRIAESKDKARARKQWTKAIMGLMLQGMSKP